MTPPLVVKLGGSHAFSGHLKDWIAALERLAGRVVVVPGGGPFADAVREAQPRMGYGDEAAHIMAMLAMEQYGHALAGLGRKLEVVNSLAGLRRTVRELRVPVWSPIPMASRAAAIAKSWSVTSDSLALWLACKLRADRLLLVKQRSPDDPRNATQLSDDGLVDAAYPAMYSGCAVQGWIAGPVAYGSLEAFAAGEDAGMIRIARE